MAGLAPLGNPITIAMLLLGNIIGFIFGILPGLSGVQALALVLPFTFGMEPLLAMYIYAGIMGSITLGGAVSAILISTPGTPGNIVTTIEGYAMAKRGEAGRALAISAFASGIGTFVGLAILIILLPIVEHLILNIRAPEVFWIVVLGLCSIAFVVRGNFLKGVVAALIGILIALIGRNPLFPVSRFDLGIWYLWDGIYLPAFMVGVFAISQVLILVTGRAAPTKVKRGWQDIADGFKDVFRYFRTFFRSCILGTIVGIIPGLGASVANALSYTATVRFAKVREGERPFGTGNLEGLVASESSNNAKDGGAVLTTVAFGIPGSPEMAVLLGAFVLHGLTPGLMLITEHADIVWTIILGLFFSQFVCVAWVLGGATWLSRISTLRAEFVTLPVLLACLAGSYAAHKNIWDVFVMVTAGFLAFGMRRFGFPVVALAIGFILGSFAETNFMQSLAISRGSISILFNRPISIALIVVIMLIVVLPVYGATSRRTRKGKQTEPGDNSTAPTRVKRPDSMQESHEPFTRQKVNRAAIIFESGLLVTVAAFIYSSLQLGPGPGTFPLIASAGAFILLVPVIVSELVPNIQRYLQTGVEYLLGGGQEPVQEPAQAEYQEKSQARTVGGMAVLIIVTLFVTLVIGFLAAVPLCFLVYLVLWQKMGWQSALVFTAGCWVFLFFGLDQLMGLDLWRGAFPELMPGWLGGEIVPRLW